MESIRYLRNDEKEITRPMWERIFSEDSKEFLDYYYEEKTRENEILVLEKDGELCSMLQLNPYRMQIGMAEHMCAYVIAVATEDRCRHQGMMRKLLLRAMCDRLEQNQPFLFLIPADPAIYEPFGFRFVYRQNFLDIAKKEGSGYFLRSMRDEEAQAAAEFVNEQLARLADIYALRDTAYYQLLKKESQAEDGDVAWIVEERTGRTIGLLSYTKGEQIDVREPLLEAGYTEQLEDVLASCFSEYKLPIHVFGCEETLRTQKKPVIMVRLLCLKALLQGIRTEENREWMVRIHDELLPENDGIFLWKAGPESCSFEKISIADVGEPDLDMTIEEFTELIFCSLPNRVFINEVV